MVTNESGAVVEQTFYEPFGKVISGGTASRFQYEAKEYDSVVGDYDFHARKVNPDWGVFTQPDTIIQNVYDPQMLNRYAFERNNPYKYVDESGNVAILAPILIGAGIGATFGIATYFIKHYLSDKQYSVRGALSYAAGGAAAGAIFATGAILLGTGLAASMGSGALSAGASQIGMNIGEGTEWHQGLAGAMTAGSILGGVVGQMSPLARTWLIKHPTSYFTTTTGQTFMANAVRSEMASLGYNVLSATMLSRMTNAVINFLSAATRGDESSSESGNSNNQGGYGGGSSGSAGSSWGIENIGGELHIIVVTPISSDDDE